MGRTRAGRARRRGWSRPPDQAEGAAHGREKFEGGLLDAGVGRSRRQQHTEDVGVGGGRTGCVVVDQSGCPGAFGEIAGVDQISSCAPTRNSGSGGGVAEHLRPRRSPRWWNRWWSSGSARWRHDRASRPASARRTPLTEPDPDLEEASTWEPSATAMPPATSCPRGAAGRRSRSRRVLRLLHRAPRRRRRRTPRRVNRRELNLPTVRSRDGCSLACRWWAPFLGIPIKRERLPATCVLESDSEQADQRKPRCNLGGGPRTGPADRARPPRRSR